jgi:hypothetical protein
MTFDPMSKEKTEPHSLLHDPVPLLLPGTKPQKNDGDTSTRTSSPMPPPDTPSTPAKVAQSISKVSERFFDLYPALSPDLEVTWILG